MGGRSQTCAGSAPAIRAEHDGGLADKNLQDFPFEPAIAKRHALQMLLVDDALRQ